MGQLRGYLMPLVCAVVTPLLRRLTGELNYKSTNTVILRERIEALSVSAINQTDCLSDWQTDGRTDKLTDMQRNWRTCRETDNERIKGVCGYQGRLNASGPDWPSSSKSLHVPSLSLSYTPTHTHSFLAYAYFHYIWTYDCPHLD